MMKAYNELAVIWNFCKTKIVSLKKGNMQNYLIFDLIFNI